MSKSVYIEQLGCPKNEVDGEHLLGALRRAGFVRSSTPEGSDVYLINTCSFIEPAKEESIARILELAGRKRNGTRLLVAGCLAQRYPGALLADIPEIDALVGVDRLDLVVDAARGTQKGNCFVGRPAREYAEPEAPREFSGGTWAYIKISDGCDNACAFCAIPQFRGAHRSRRFEDIQAEAEQLAAAGVVELVVVAQDTTSYGVDRYGRRRLSELLLSLSGVPGIRWVRLMYAFPRHVDDELLDVLVSAPGIVRYLDMPIQHIDDGMLGRMNRGLGERETRSLLERIRKRHDGMALRTSVVVGHPGESGDAFAKLADFIADFAFDRLGVFVYSLEEGTKASHMQPRLDGATSEYRRRFLLDIQSDLLAGRQEAQVGRQMEIHVESRENGAFWGRTEADAPEVDCAARIEGEVKPGDVVLATCTGTFGVDLVVRAHQAP